MTVEMLQTLSLISYIAAGILFLAGSALYFLLDVPKLYNDISGRTARKAIEAIRNQNESTGNKAYQPSRVNSARGKLTDKITASERLVPHTDDLPASEGTEKFSTVVLVPQENETTLLAEQAGGIVLPSEKSALAEETTLLVQEEQATGYAGFTVDVEMSFRESEEMIE